MTEGGRRRTDLRRWLTPGIGVKRWVLLTFAGLFWLTLEVREEARERQDAIDDEFGHGD